MFPIIPILIAVLAGLGGLELAAENPAARPEPGSLLLLAVVPAGELSVLLARRRARTRRRPGFVRLALVPVVALGSYAAASIFFGWPRIVYVLGIERWVLLDEVLVLAPYPIASALGRLYRHRIAAAFVRARPPRPARTVLLLGFRGEIALLAPLLFFVLAGDLISLDPKLEQLVAGTPGLLYGLIFLSVVLLAVLFPAALKLLWQLKPLRAVFPGHAELAGFIRGQGFRMRDLLMWDTGGLMVNAAILGLLPRWRYILLTDAILKIFSLDELKATVAHEIGHGKHGHTAFFIAVSLAFLAGLAIADAHLGPFEVLEDELLGAALFYLPAAAFYAWFLFGFLSRRFEIEADVFAARAFPDPKTFINTLERLGNLNVLARHRAGMRHFSLDRRIGLLERFFPAYAGGAEHPGAAPPSPALARFEKRMKALKILALSLSAAAMIAFAADVASRAS